MSSAVSRREFLGHPVGVYVLLAVETWERFSYFGMRALLVFYMIDGLSFSQSKASEIYGAYTSLVYLTPIAGAIIADRWTGYYRAVALGCGLMVAGHFMLAFEPLFYPALCTLIVATGFFKTNISTQVGHLYRPDDPRRDRGYALYYLGINLGGIFAPIVCGTVGELYGWHYGFGLAGAGMSLGLFIYIIGRKNLTPVEGWESRKLEDTSRGDGSVDKQYSLKHVLPLFLIALAMIPFWVSYEQLGNTFAVFVFEEVNRQVSIGPLSFALPATLFQSLNPLFVVIFAPILSVFWGYQSKTGKEPLALSKMRTGLIIAVSSFLVLSLTTFVGPEYGGYSITGPILYILLLTIGDIYIVPVALSYYNYVAPAGYSSILLSVWFGAMSAGNFLSGVIGQLWEVLPHYYYFLILAFLVVCSGISINFVMLKQSDKPIKEYA